MPTVKELSPVTAEPGTPLYVAVKNRLTRAIHEGVFKPGERLPSTQEISRLLHVSLVTTHRALQELESQGAVDRLQGRGTFVADADAQRTEHLRLRLMLQPEASLADYYHGQVLEGMNRGAREARCELSIVQGSGRQKSSAHGYILLNPLAEQVDALADAVKRSVPVLVAGARHDVLPWLDVDNVDLIEQALAHAHQLGHRRVAFIGGADELSNSRDRRAGFVRGCERFHLKPETRRDVIAKAWRLDPDERMTVHDMLTGEHRPSAVIAGGYHLALDVYQIANTLGLDIPGDLTVIGVDDPPSAAHLDPPMTTLAQPLIHLGHAAVQRMINAVRGSTPLPPRQTLRANLVIRGSSGPAA